MNIFSLDPGPTKAGWAFLQINGGKITVSLMGHDEWHVIREAITNLKPDAIVVEKVIIYRGVAGAFILPDSIRNCGRIEQIAEDQGIEYHQYTRATVISLVTGTTPGNGRKKITKAQMKNKVADLIGISTRIKPIHAADAIAVGVGHLINIGKFKIKKEKVDEKRVKKTNPKKGSGGAKQLALCNTTS